MSKETLTKSIREIPDFPIPGILFYDVTTLFKEPTALQELSDTLYEMYKDKGITKVVGIESRGFIMGPILATRLGAGFVPIRKPGKLHRTETECRHCKKQTWRIEKIRPQQTGLGRGCLRSLQPCSRLWAELRNA